MRIYISGKIAGLTPTEAARLFRDGEIEANNFFRQFSSVVETINPITACEGNTKFKTYDDFMREDIRLLMGCAGIWMLKGWRDSKGATVEHDLAKALHMAIGYEND